METAILYSILIFSLYVQVWNERDAILLNSINFSAACIMYSLLALDLIVIGDLTFSFGGWVGYILAESCHLISDLNRN